MNYILYYDLLMNDILYKNVTLWPHNDLIMITSWYNNLGKGKAMTRKISYKAIYRLLLLKTNCHQTCFPKEHFNLYLFTSFWLVQRISCESLATGKLTFLFIHAFVPWPALSRFYSETMKQNIVCLRPAYVTFCNQFALLWLSGTIWIFWRCF